MRILFLGEGESDGSARYLAAILTWSKIRFDHCPDQCRIPKAWYRRRYDAVLLSDYRYSSWTRDSRQWLKQSVQSGTGLLMIGGWASFTGQVGGYAGTDIESLLPVTCIPGDDRVNQPAVLSLRSQVLSVVNGYHKVHVKAGAKTVLEFRDLRFTKVSSTLGPHHPALVTGKAGKARTAAFMTDCAPHWAGGLIDWGKRRVKVNLRGHGIVETGEEYLKFFEKWILWVGRH